MEELIKIQSALKAPKKQYNKFGKYNYRSCEDILESVKPLLHENKCQLIISDDITCVNERVYVKATAIISNNAGETVKATAFAREEEVKKGMDASQITGSASSYARKYALNGLFCIDDTKDADSIDNKDIFSDNLLMACQEIEYTDSMDELKSIYGKYMPTMDKKEQSILTSKLTEKKNIILQK